MSLENRKKTGIGKKIDSHEFDFNTNAWDKMESMLDDQNPPEARRIIPYFFTFKMIAAMVFLIVLAFFLLPVNQLNISPNEAIAGIEKQTDKDRDNSSDLTTKKFPETQNRSSSEAENGSMKPKIQIPTTNPIQVPETPNRSSSGAENESMETQSPTFAENQTQKIKPQTKTITTTEASKKTPPNPKQAILNKLPASVILRDARPTYDVSIPIRPIVLAPKVDSTFLPKLEEKLAARNKHFASEKVYLQFDKPFFKPGETVWFNAFVRDANTLVASEKSDFLHVELLKPNGGILQKIKIKSTNGTAAGDFQIPQAANGGIYKIKAYTNWQRNEETFFEREITVQKNVLPNLRMKLDFMKKSYGAGDEVIANLDLKTLANEFLKSHDFEAKIALNGNDFKTVKGKTDEEGQSKINFRLPQKLDSNNGMLNVMISYNGQTESISRPIPILLKKIDLQFFPEGGELVANFETKIAFKAIDEFGKPADIQGVITNSTGIQVATFESFHDGMGGFDFSAKTAEKYFAKITKPKGIEQIYELPTAQKRGYALKVSSLEKGKNLQAKINSTEQENLTLVVRAADKIQFSKTVYSYQKEINIPTDNLPVGIAQITLFDSKNIPRAERLAFVNADKNLNIEIKTNKEKYLPREKVSMSVEVTDDRGMGVPGQFSLAVADDKLLSYADDKQGHILSQLLIQSELKGEIREPNFYFEKDDIEPAKSRAVALDYLMLTHGWRRFAWESLLMKPKFAEAKFKGEKEEIAGQVLNAEGEPVAGVDVFLADINLKTKTDENGCFLFDTPNFLPNQYQLQISKNKNVKYNTFSGYKNDLKLYFGNGAKPVFSPGNGYVTGKLLDEETGESLVFANVMLEQNGKLIHGTQTDFDGFYAFENIPVGNYNLVANYIGYMDSKITDVPVYSEKQSTLDVTMHEGGVLLEEVVINGYGKSRKAREREASKRYKSNLDKGTNLNEVVVTAYKIPLIEQDKTTSGGTLTSEQLKKLPTRNIAAIAANVAGVSVGDEGDDVYMKGSRSGSTFYMVDGIRVRGNLIPMEEVEVELPLMNGTPAQFSNKAQFKKEANSPPRFPIRSKPAAKKDKRSNRNYPRSFNAYQISFLECEMLTGQNRNTCTQNKLNELIYSPLNYPIAARKKGTSGLVYVNANIDKDGKIKSTSIGRSLSKECDEEALRIVNQFPKMEINKAYKAQFPGIVQIPISFGPEGFAEKLTTAGIYTPRQFYTPKYESKEAPEIRENFRETIYWNPSITTDRNGKATVEFYASDAITTFQATLEGIGISGELGRGTQTFFTQLPFGMSVKMPANLIEGDLVNVPVSVSNHTDEKVKGKLTIAYPSGFEPIGDLPSKIEMNGGEQKTIFIPFRVKNNATAKEFLQVQFKAKGLHDAFVQEVKTSPRGFPVSEVFSGNELEKTFDLNIVNPVSGSVRAEFAAHPSPVSDLISGLDRMLRQPNGCFEQTSSSNYPNLLAINYLRESGENQPEVEKRGKGFLKKGYNRLKTFEVKGGGFDWYGKAPAHEGLTAYGLMQFQDMKGVHNVEQDLINRTAKWLLSRRDGKGGWKKKQQGAHRWMMSNEISDGYISWALSEAGYGKKIEKEIEKSLNNALFSEDAYLLALMANTMLNSNDKRAKDLLKRLLEFQSEDGSWTGKTTSIVGSRGKNLTVETTGLAALALMKTGDRSVALQKAIDYLAAAKTNYGFGSTQATVLAMKALVKYAIFSKRMSEDGMIALYLNGDKIAEEKYKSGQTKPLIFNDLEKHIRNGDQNLKVKFSKTKTALPFEFSLKYSTAQPLNAADCRVKLTTDLRKAKAAQGDNIRFDVSVKNITSEGLPNTIAIVGIPAGMSTQPKQLKKMSEEGVFDFYEILPTGYIAFHFRGMAPNEIKAIPLELKADLSGEFESPASVAYLYYENDLQFWSKPEKVVIE